MSNTILFILLAILYTGFIGVISYLWFQFNSTSSRLNKQIDNRINLFQVNNSEEIIEEE